MAIGKDALKAGMGDAVSKQPTFSTDASPLLAMLGANVPSGQDISEVNIALLDSHPEQGQYSMDENELAWLAENIADIGVIDPVHIRPAANGRYTILAGHRRVAASKLAGKTTIPATIDNVDDDTATLIFHATNIGSRQKILLSTKARAYEAMEKALAAKGLLNGRTSAAIAEKFGENKRTIQRIKRLNEIKNDYLLKAVDTEDIPLYAAVDISHIIPNIQGEIADVMAAFQVTKVSMQQAAALRQAAMGEVTLTQDAICEALGISTGVTNSHTSAEKKEKQRVIKLPFEKLVQYFDEAASDDEVIEAILAALAESIEIQEGGI